MLDPELLRQPRVQSHRAFLPIAARGFLRVGCTEGLGAAFAAFDIGNPIPLPSL
ncbi:MAG: hypothetical protein WAU52_14580 [Burkholderiales bacterium]